MKVLPAIDIKNGNCVRLKKGNFKNVKVYSDSPIEQANHFKNNGFDFIHIVDLDGALNGKRVNIKIIDEIINLGINVQLGGGIRSISDIKNLIDIGVQRVIVSTAAIENDNFLSEVLNKINEKNITLALDFRVINGIPFLASKGWTFQTKINLYEFIKNNMIENILATDINKDGLLSGPNLKIYKEMKKLFPDLNIIGSGGISSLEDIDSLSKININECVVGKAIYENKISLEELFNVD
ncbi:MAG: 1-(5-phosphoribosyl)-5-[(5-phosphoribosylamino)methylideneamino]imidazole-4-carboxamide isomerase [SAR86 cluster bacterium]|uniref:1-(5-phosphoribosyl)-5-[(5-phosphoribosylamino)methylideneamino] imidazole-4-carboxamide isomerase n=1 Tax=SAR86 cluster bacterium TaxID=2030880 RepID=A0A520MYN5_9GAMM|nr:MAG: 1-(5-phosphoribosyl)-5-[(5-phosphoribosylamino)methylideneamino]imidazole-4-carboxamide isomerase [SAR86 cluster bacterium]|tara:strand:+ start:7106 stop:7822 length:717 start_codon:yes stop_codon:yes gene_type:complete